MSSDVTQYDEGSYANSCHSLMLAETLIERASERARLEVEAIERTCIPDRTLRYWSIGRWHLVSPWHPAYDTVRRDYVCDEYDARLLTWRMLP